MSRGVRIGIVVIVVIAGFLVATLIVAPRVFEIDTYRPEVVSLLQEKTGRQFEIGHLSLVLFPTVTIRADNVAIDNPANFPSGTWLTVKRISAQLALGALWNRQIVVRTLKLDQPALNLISNGQGHWNFQVPSPPTLGAAHASDPPLFTLEEITKVVLKDGILAVQNLKAGRPETLVAGKGISGNLDNINLNALNGAGPNSPLPSRDILRSLPPIPNATGDLSVEALNVGALLVTKLSSKVETSSAQIQLNGLHFDFYDGKGTGSVRLDLTKTDPQFQAQAHLSDVNVQELLEAFPAWPDKITGRLESSLNTSGNAEVSGDPWAGKKGEGTVIIRKGRLPRLQLNKSLLDLARLAELGPAKGDLSAFSSITADWRLARGVISSRNIRIIGNGITVDGSGNSDLAGPGRLHYQGVAQVEARKNALSNVLAGLAGSELKDGRIALPFVLEGTFSKPVFRLNPNSNSGLPAAVSHPEQDEQMLRGLFNLFQHQKPQNK